MATRKNHDFFLFSTLSLGVPDTGSKATHSSAWIGLSNLEDDMYNGFIKYKKEKYASSLPPNKAHINLTSKTPCSWNRKTIEAIDLSLEYLEFEGTQEIDIFF